MSSGNTSAGAVIQYWLRTGAMGMAAPSGLARRLAQAPAASMTTGAPTTSGPDRTPVTRPWAARIWCTGRCSSSVAPRWRAARA